MKKTIISVLGAIVCVAAVAVGIMLFCAVPRAITLPDLPTDGEKIQVGKYTLQISVTDGTFSAAKDGVTLFHGAHSEYALGDRVVSSKDYTNIDVQAADSDECRTVTVTMQKEDLPTLVQHFILYPDRNYFLTDIQLVSADGEVATNYIAPLVVEHGNLQNGAPQYKKILEVPFDNDGWVEFQVKDLYRSTVSYEVGALFTPDEGGGFVLGSVEHTLWKTAVTTDGANGRVRTLKLYCGATDPRTGDEPHGTVRGQTVSSPKMFVGAFDNWKEGMRTFTDTNLAQQPKRAAVTEEVPFGWNSWGSVQDKLNYDIAVGMSDYIHNNLQSAWQTQADVVYVNLDSWWDMLSDDQLAAFVEHCHQNGQKAGIYSGPFIQWAGEEDMAKTYVPGTNDTVTYQDIRLKKSDGTYYGNEVDGCYPLDVTHPATKLHVQAQIDRFKAAGFDYIKLDFLVHASFEGDFYDPQIQTGIEAYNYAMTYVTEMLGDDMFINLAMSPTFPYQYANGRRIACDAFYSLGETEYTLNAVTYGFWEQGLYDYPDPDHLVIWGKDGKATEGEARCRLTLGAIAGTSFLTGDNFVAPAKDADTADARYRTMLTNPDLLRVASVGEAFTPVIDEDCPRAAEVYRLSQGDTEYIAVFNFGALPKTVSVTLPDEPYTAKEVWSGEVSSQSGEMQIRVAGKDAVLYILEKV